MIYNLVTNGLKYMFAYAKNDDVGIDAQGCKSSGDSLTHNVLVRHMFTSLNVKADKILIFKQRRIEERAIIYQDSNYAPLALADFSIINYQKIIIT